MRDWFWIALIALSLTAIAAGFLGGTVTTHPPATVALHPDSRASSTPLRIEDLRGEARGMTDIRIDDLFSDDNVVIERPPAADLGWQPARLRLVVGLCGESLPVESGFLTLGVPLAIDLDPTAAQAVVVAAAARSNGDRVYVHLDRPPRRSELASLAARFGVLDGIASRNSAGMAAALNGTGLAFFDERGDAQADAFRLAGVPFAQRDATIDDRAAGTYVSFMLELAQERSQSEGPLVLLMRPLPSTLDALTNFVQNHAAEIVSLQ